MDVKTFMRNTTPDERARVAAHAETSVGYLQQLAGGHSRPSGELAVRLELATAELTPHARMTREELRPDLFLRGHAAA